MGRPATVARYIELNPVRAKICLDPPNYRWRSADAACRGGQDGRSGFSPLQAPRGTWEEVLRLDPIRDSTDHLKLLRRSVSTGRPFGSKEFLEQIEKQTGMTLGHKKPGRKSS